MPMYKTPVQAITIHTYYMHISRAATQLLTCNTNSAAISKLW